MICQAQLEEEKHDCETFREAEDDAKKANAELLALNGQLQKQLEERKMQPDPKQAQIPPDWGDYTSHYIHQLDELQPTMGIQLSDGKTFAKAENAPEDDASPAETTEKLPDGLWIRNVAAVRSELTNTAFHRWVVVNGSEDDG